MAAYDANGDGALDDVELAAVPGILMHKDKYDLDGDGRVSRQEIADRIALWRSQAMGITSIDVIVKLDKRPLAGAEISFVPEEYLGPGPKVATGVTDARGYAKMGVALEELPEALRTARLRGVFGGVYKIEVRHPQRSLPERYNASTQLGDEIARDTLRERITLELTSQ